MQFLHNEFPQKINCITLKTHEVDDVLEFAFKDIEQWLSDTENSMTMKWSLKLPEIFSQLVPDEKKSRNDSVSLVSLCIYSSGQFFLARDKFKHNLKCFIWVS